MCKRMCLAGEEFHPLEECKCANSEKIVAEVYPEWATKYDIQSAKDAGMNRYWSKPVCKKKCDEGFYLN